MDMLRISIAGLACLLPLAGCARKAVPPAAPTAPKKSTGRLVPAVLAGFEHGAGGWSSEISGTGVSGNGMTVISGGAAKGDKWLARRVNVPQGRTDTVNVYGKVPAQDWSRFGDTVRASVRATPAGAAVTARLYLVSTDGKEMQGPEQTISSDWSTLVWEAGDAVRQVSRIGVAFTVPGPFDGQLGLDNVRIGAKDALAAAWTVATGPFPNRERAVARMNDLKASGVDSYPLYEQGWYLGLGTFSTRKAAQAEGQRLDTSGMMTTILER